MLLQSIEELRRKSKIPSHKLSVILRSVHAGKIKHKISL